MFMAEKGPGFHVSRKLEKFGYKGIDRAELIFEDYRIPGEKLVGEEGQRTSNGARRARTRANQRGRPRLRIGERGARRMRSATAQLRKTFGKPICEHQAIQLKLAEMATRLQAAIALTYNAARIYDEGAVAIWKSEWPSTSLRRLPSKTP